ncbi:MAG: hypothetical protein R3F02_08515 [Thiolinea sp.]
MESLPNSPPRENECQRSDENPALNANLLEQVVTNANIQQAWQQVRRNKGAAGVDGITIEQFTDWVKPQWSDLKEQLLTGCYFLSPLSVSASPKMTALIVYWASQPCWIG